MYRFDFVREISFWKMERFINKGPLLLFQARRERRQHDPDSPRDARRGRVEVRAPQAVLHGAQRAGSGFAVAVSAGDLYADDGDRTVDIPGQSN